MIVRLIAETLTPPLSPNPGFCGYVVSGVSYPITPTLTSRHRPGMGTELP